MITLHSLDQSRALRIVWLLEILGTPYRLQTYRRHPDTLLALTNLKPSIPWANRLYWMMTALSWRKAARLPTI